jgi:hypothetical protein
MSDFKYEFVLDGQEVKKEKPKKKVRLTLRPSESMGGGVDLATVDEDGIGERLVLQITERGTIKRFGGGGLEDIGEVIRLDDYDGEYP